jgi:competence protein ComEC
MGRSAVSSSLQPVHTRFRAYQLGTAGSSFSYFAGSTFTLIEGRMTATSLSKLREELRACGKASPDTLHITSWDNDHCNVAELEALLYELPPNRIEYPGYPPESDCGKACLSMVRAYERKWVSKGFGVRIQGVDPPYIASLTPAQALGYRDIFYHPRQTFQAANDNSTIKFFRTGCFNVLSLGDVMDPAISTLLQRCWTLCREVDVMILAHHGADNGFTTGKLLDQLNPTVAVCTSNWGNQHDHPRPAVRGLLDARGIPLYTTKCGDVVIESTGSHTMDYVVRDYKEGGLSLRDVDAYRSRKSAMLRMNRDSLRNLLQRPNRGPR